MGAIALPFVCVANLIFGDGCDLDESFELARQYNPVDYFEGWIPGYGDGFDLATLPAGPFSQVGVGLYFVCGVRSGGQLACHGLDVVLDDLPSSNFSSFAAFEAGCGVGVDGALSCWGSTGMGIQDVPVGRFTEISVGRHRACAIDELGALACWGSLRGVQVPTGEFAQVSESVAHGCAIRTDGTLACWSEPGGSATADLWDDDWGQADPPVGRFRQVSAGWAHTCALAEDGHVECWGAGAQQGDCSAERLDECGMLLAPDETFVEIASTAYFSCGIRTAGGVVCWGTPGSAKPPASLE